MNTLKYSWSCEQAATKELEVAWCLRYLLCVQARNWACLQAPIGAVITLWSSTCKAWCGLESQTVMFWGRTSANVKLDGVLSDWGYCSEAMHLARSVMLARSTNSTIYALTLKPNSCSLEQKQLVHIHVHLWLSTNRGEQHDKATMTQLTKLVVLVHICYSWIYHICMHYTSTRIHYSVVQWLHYTCWNKATGSTTQLWALSAAKYLL